MHRTLRVLLPAVWVLLSVQVSPSLQRSNNAKLDDLYQKLRAELPIHDFVCLPTAKLFCDKGSCQEAEPTVLVLLAGRPETKWIFRCDVRGCDKHEAVSQVAGLFENVQLAPPRGVILKRALKDEELTGTKRGDFVEVVTQLLGAHISTGSCRDAR